MLFTVNLTPTEPVYSVLNQVLCTETLIISRRLFTSSWSLSVLHHSRVHWRRQLYSLSHKLSARPQQCKRPCLQRWKPSKVNDKAWLLCFMCHSEIATWLKPRSGERQWGSAVSHDSCGISSCIVPPVSRPLPLVNGLNHVRCPLSCRLSPYRVHYIYTQRTADLLARSIFPVITKDYFWDACWFLC